MKHLLSILLIFVVLPVYSQKILMDCKKEFYNISSQIYIAEDKDHNTKIEDILVGSNRLQFYHYNKPILNFGFNRSSYWIKFQLDNQCDRDLVLEIGHTHLDVVQFYMIKNNSIVKHEAMGYNIPLNKKNEKHHFQIFSLPPGQYDYYVRINMPVQPIPVRIYDESYFEIKSYRERLIFGFYIGLMIFVVISNLFFYISLRNHLFLFYTFLVLLYISYASIVMDGFIVYFVSYVDLKFWYIHIPTIGVTLQTIYAINFLEIKKYAPRLFKIAVVITIYFALYAIFKIFLPYVWIYAINTTNALMSFFLMFYLGFIAGKRGNKLGYYFALAYILYFILVLIESIYIQLGAPRYVAGISYVAWATLFEAFILSFLLSKRFEWERMESDRARELAQAEVLEKTMENEKIVKEQNILLEHRVNERTQELKKSLDDLKLTQDKLIQSEKLASLGELTAGIAHEIQNPLNFVNNFSETSLEILGELNDSISNVGNNELKDMSDLIKLNLEKINFHGNRASNIVKGMLQHSRISNGLKDWIDINMLCEEFFRLAYHGLRAKDKEFNTKMETEFDSKLPKIYVVPQDIGRSILNLVTNAFHAVTYRYKAELKNGNQEYKPFVKIRTQYVKKKQKVEISIIDNGVGVPNDIKNRIFQPFFTTKSPGQGTGLGLSITYEIIKAHNGDINLESEAGKETIFTITLPVGLQENK
ncbi:MAG: 7TM-DISM domain-containing protein [Saprospiraceae bacterium]